MTTSSGNRVTPLVVLAEVGGALVIGLIFGALLGLLAFPLFSGAGLGMGLLSVQLFAGVIGFGIGAGLGIWLVGRMLKQSGSLWVAMIAGALTGIVVILVFLLFDLGGLGGILWSGITLTLLAALLGYHLSRRS